jgi:two-component system OmpR family sensor kinase
VGDERLNRVVNALATRLTSLSLRVRLVAVSLVLVTVGLTVAGAVTHRSLRTFLIERVDAQLLTAREPAGREVVRGDFSRFRGFPGGPVRTRPSIGDLPQGIVAGLYDLQGTPVREQIGSGVEIPQRSEAGYFTAELPKVGAYRFLSIDVTEQITGEPLRFVLGIPLDDVESTLGRLLLLELLVGLGVLAAIGGAGWWLVRLGLRPLSDIERTAATIAAGDLSERIDTAPSTTEVGRLGASLNTMLGTIEASFAERAESERRLRQFVADASHELQTPLTSVRGYAELFRRGAADRPEDLANAMSRIEAEATRMGVLVDDLLMLAHLDQGRPLELDQVDLVTVAREIVGDARVVDPDRPIELIAPDPVEITGDGHRLRQVVANLLSNARTHTPPGTAVRVSIRRVGDAAVLEVFDRGPGMLPEHADRVFERFFRVDPSRARASGGSGLGLAIVAAIAHAHGGSVDVESTPGEGATFRVVLPVAGAAGVQEAR